MAFRDLTGQFYTDILDDVQVLIDRGRGAIRLATDGHSIRVFVRRASDYLIGGTYEVPSGLGGTFRVILKDACDTFAIVQNCGNCEDFDAMQPYRVPLDALGSMPEGGVTALSQTLANTLQACGLSGIGDNNPRRALNGMAFLHRRPRPDLRG